MATTTKAKNGNRSAANGAQDKAKHVGEEVTERAQELAQKARGPLRDQVDLRTTKLGRQVKSNAADVRSVARELKKEGDGVPARIAEEAADRAEAIGSYLTDADGEKIIHDVEEFSRRNPWAVAAGALVLGFAASRALKASSGRRYSTKAATS